MPIKAMIIDDEPFARDDIKYMLSAHEEVDVAWETGKIEDARKLLSENRPDVVFLDIELRGGSGLYLIPDIDPDTRIVFVTAHPEYAGQAVKTNIVDCIPKPVSASRLAESLEKIKGPLKNNVVS